MSLRYMIQIYRTNRGICHIIELPSILECSGHILLNNRISVVVIFYLIMKLVKWSSFTLADQTDIGIGNIKYMLMYVCVWINYCV